MEALDRKYIVKGLLLHCLVPSHACGDKKIWGMRMSMCFFQVPGHIYMNGLNRFSKDIAEG